MHDIFKHLINFIVILNSATINRYAPMSFSRMRYHTEMAVGQVTIVTSRGESDGSFI